MYFISNKIFTNEIKDPKSLEKSTQMTTDDLPPPPSYIIFIYHYRTTNIKRLQKTKDNKTTYFLKEWNIHKLHKTLWIMDYRLRSCFASESFGSVKKKL